MEINTRITATKLLYYQDTIVKKIVKISDYVFKK